MAAAALFFLTLCLRMYFQYLCVSYNQIGCSVSNFWTDSRTKLLKASFSGGECFHSLTLNLRQQDIYATTCDFHHQTGPKLYFSTRTHYTKKERVVKMNSRTFFKMCVCLFFRQFSIAGFSELIHVQARPTPISE